jgi:hypothetical protein
VSVPSESNGRPSNPQEAAGLLSSLPRTRPQRSTPRRTAARDAVAAETSATASDPPSASAPATPRSRPAKRAKAGASTRAASSAKTLSSAKASTSKGPTKARKRPAPKRPPTAMPAGEPVPPQGFEAEGDHAHGAVRPPSGGEMVGAATEILGELAKAGISAGERLFKDVLSRLPLS